jgi:F1F0 ATPase subunit 2
MLGPLSLLAPYFVLGALLGAGYFGGLYLTVNRLHRLSRPGAALVWSFLLRAGALLGALWLVAGTGWTNLAVCAAGFLLTRQAVLMVTRPRAAPGAGERGPAG